MIDRTDQLAMNQILATADTLGSPKRGALHMLEEISGGSESLELRPCDIAKALAKNHDTLSPTGMYWRVQEFLLRYLGSLGALVISVLGIAAVFWLIKKAATSVKNKVIGHIESLGAWAVGLAAGGASFGILGLLLGKKLADENGATGPSADGLLGGLSAVVPLPVALLAKDLSDAMSGMASSGGIVSTDVPEPNVAPASPALTGNLSSISKPSATQPSTLASVTSLLTSPAVENAASDLYSYLFGGSDTGTTTADADPDLVKEVLKTAVALGVHPDDLKAVLSRRTDAIVRDGVIRDANFQNVSSSGI